jgi:DNA-binding HxlR family transcriptional regulator
MQGILKQASPSELPHRSGCPISIALELLGDAWSLLIVRDVMFKGRHTFNEFMAGGEGIATNILADRLRRLEGAGIVEQQPDPADRRRHLYRLTRKGIDLAPVLVELVVWSATYEATDAPPAVVRQMRRARRAFLAGVHRQWRSPSGAPG